MSFLTNTKYNHWQESISDQLCFKKVFAAKGYYKQ